MWIYVTIICEYMWIYVYDRKLYSNHNSWKPDRICFFAVCIILVYYILYKYISLFVILANTFIFMLFFLTCLVFLVWQWQVLFENFIHSLNIFCYNIFLFFGLTSDDGIVLLCNIRICNALLLYSRLVLNFICLIFFLTIFLGLTMAYFVYELWCVVS